jgi:hypothetical protein
MMIFHHEFPVTTGVIDTQRGTVHVQEDDAHWLDRAVGIPRAATTPRRHVHQRS